MCEQGVHILKILQNFHFSDAQLEEYLQKQAKTQGFISKKQIERLVQFRRIFRPFRRVSFEVATSNANETRSCESLIDEEAASHVNDSSHRFLLWRPKYSTTPDDEIDQVDNVASNEMSVNDVIEELVLTRWEGQELDEELRPKLRSLQADPLAVIALVIPRQPGSLRREEEILDDSRESHAYVLASSLVTNSSPKEIIQSYSVGSRVFVETVAAKYEGIADSAERYVFLETSGGNSLDAAMKAGAVLARLSNLYAELLSTMKDSYGI